MIKFKTKDLQKAFKELSPAVKANAIIPILEYVECTCSKNHVSLRATNTNLDILVGVEAECEEGKVLLPFAQINNQLSTFLDDYIVFELDNSQLKMTSGAKVWQIPTDLPIHFPVLTETGEMQTIEVGEEYITALKEAGKHRTTNTFKPFIAGVCIKDNDIVAIENSYAYTRKLKYHVKGKYHLQHIFGDSLQQAPATLHINNKFVSAKQGNKTVRCTLYEQKFADYHVFFPKKEIEWNLEISANVLLRNLESIIGFRDNISICVLGFKPGILSISYNNVDTQEKFYTEISCFHKVEISEIELFANPFKKILQDSGEELQLFISSQGAPVYITSEKEGLLNFIMPSAKK